MYQLLKKPQVYYKDTKSKKVISRARRFKLPVLIKLWYKRPKAAREQKTLPIVQHIYHKVFLFQK